MNGNNNEAKQATNLLKTRTPNHPRNQSRNQCAASSSAQNQSTSSSRSRPTSRHRSISQTRTRINHSEETFDQPTPTNLHSRSLDEVTTETHQQLGHRLRSYLNNLRQPDSALLRDNPTARTRDGVSDQRKSEGQKDRSRELSSSSASNNVHTDSTNASGEDNIQDLLSCTVCFELYDDDAHQAKLLACHHSLCKQCILTLISAPSSRGSNSVAKGQLVVCPTCRNTTVMPAAASRDASVARMQTNFYVAQMKDLIGSAVRPTRAGQGAQSCAKHENEILDLFCRSCVMSICQQCRAVDHSQVNGHMVKTIAEVTSEEIGLMKMEMASAWHLVVTGNDRVKRLQTESSCFLAAKQRAQNDVCAEFASYSALLDQRRHALLSDINREYDERSTELRSDIETTTKSLSSLAGVIEKCNEASDSGSVNAIIAYRTSLRSKCHGLKNVDVFERCRNNLIAFRATDARRIDEVVAATGNVSCDLSLPNFFKVTECHAISARQSTATLLIKDLREDNAASWANFIVVEIKDGEEDVIASSLEQTQDGSWCLTFWPQISGPHRLSVKFCDKPLPGTTQYLDVQSNDPISTIGGYRHCEESEDADEVMQYPRDIAVDASENIYVADSGNNRILKYDSSSRLVGKFSISSDGDDEDLSSCGIAVDNERSMLICTEVSLSGADLAQAHTVLRFTLEGQLISRVAYADLLRRALSVAVNSQGTVIIADLDGNAICFFDSHGRFVKQFGEPGSKPGQFNHPNFVCVGADDSVVVSDGDNHRIQIFDRGGNFLSKFGEHGMKKGQLNMPFGVAVDSQGNVIVVDGGNRRIQVFSGTGQLVGCIESFGDRLSAPRGIALTRDGYILIADRDNHCIRKYQYLRPCTSTDKSSVFEVSVL